MLTLTEPRQKLMELGTKLNSIGICRSCRNSLCALCTVLHITIEPNSIGLCLGPDFNVGHCQCRIFYSRIYQLVHKRATVTLCRGIGAPSVASHTIALRDRTLPSYWIIGHNFSLHHGIGVHPSLCFPLRYAVRPSFDLQLKVFLDVAVENRYLFFVNNVDLSNRHGELVLGVREINSTEADLYTTKPNLTAQIRTPACFSSPFKIR